MEHKWKIKEQQTWPFAISICNSKGNDIMKFGRHTASSDDSFKRINNYPANIEQMAMLKRIVLDHNALAGIPNEDVAAIGPEILTMFSVIDNLASGRKNSIEVIADISHILTRIEERRGK